MYINLTYKSPEEDIGNSIGLNPDGSINVKYTLQTIRELLSHNLNTINKLIEKADNITNIIPIGYGLVGINIDSPVILENLLENNIITKHPEILEEPTIDELIFSEDEETNQERLNMINNLISQDDSQNILDNKNNSDSDSEADDILDDETNTKSILNKYIHIMSSQDSDDENNDENDTDEEID